MITVYIGMEITLSAEEEEKIRNIKGMRPEDVRAFARHQITVQMHDAALTRGRSVRIRAVRPYLSEDKEQTTDGV